MNREDYITFIDGGTSDGVGFFVGNLFITAGHSNAYLYRKSDTYNRLL